MFVARGHRLIKPEVLDALVAAGCTAEQIAAAVKADQGTRTSGAERQARYRERKASQTVTSDVTERNGDASPSPLSHPDKETPPRPPKEINPTLSPPPPTRAFDDFWAAFPNKVGKSDAQRAFSKALSRIDPDTLMAGLHRYAEKTDDRPWCNPATWLNQDRWGDVPAQVARGSPKPNGIAGVAARLAKEFENADIRSDQSLPRLQPPVLNLPPTDRWE